MVLVPKAGIWILPTSLFIREHLKVAKLDYGLNMYNILKAERALLGLPIGSWQNFRNYIWNLKKLGLIRPVGTAPSLYQGQIKQYYELIPEQIKNKAWNNPRAFLYPDSYRFFPKHP